MVICIRDNHRGFEAFREQNGPDCQVSNYLLRAMQIKIAHLLF